MPPTPAFFLLSTPPTRLSPPDLAIVAFYLIAITLFGLRFSRKSKLTPPDKSPDRSLKSYFLAGNTIPWWAIALSIVSAETSTLTIVSIPGVAFAGDFGFLQIVFGYMLGRIVVAALFLPRYFAGEMLTAYQLIDRRFGPVLHKVTAALFLLTRAAAEGVRVFAISIVVSVAIGTGDTLSIAIISALTLLYTFEGGLAAVIWTDVVQMALYLAGTLVAVYSLGTHAGGWTHIQTVAAAAGKFHLFDFALNLTKTYTFWAGLLGGTFLTMASHGTDQLMVQRMLAARNLRESRLALLSSGAVIFLQFTLFLLIGAGLFVFYGPHPTTPFRTNDYIFPTFIVQSMPHGVAGLLVAAILAAAMSNLSAALNSLASTTVIDFYVPFRNRSRVPHLKDSPTVLEVGSTELQVDPTEPRVPHLKDSPTVLEVGSTEPPDTTLISRLSTIFWAIILFAIAIYSVHTGGKGHVVETGLSIASVAYGALLGVFLLGTLTSYATELGATLGMICGFALNLILWRFPDANIVFHPASPHPTVLSVPHIAWTWYVLIGSLTTFLLGSLFSLLLPRRKPTTPALLALAFLCLPLPARAQQPPPTPCGRARLQPCHKPTRLNPFSTAELHPPTSVQPLNYALPPKPCIKARLQPCHKPTNAEPALAAEGLLPTISQPPNHAPTPTPCGRARLQPCHTPTILNSFLAATEPLPTSPHSLQPRNDLLSQPQSAPASSSPKPLASSPPPDFTPVSLLINSAIAAHKLPGAVLFVGHNNKIVFHQAYGLRKLAGEPGPDGKPSPAEPMTEDTLFDMASLTKVLVTTTAILQLYEQDKLALDAPVSQYLPAFTQAIPPPPDQGQRPDLYQPGAQAPGSPNVTAQRAVSPTYNSVQNSQTNWKSRITIRQLLTHYSGLPEDISLADPWGLAAPDKPEAARRALAATPYGPPGLTFKYSDINFILLGLVVESLTQQPLDHYASNHIFAPIGMSHTRYLPLNLACGLSSEFPPYSKPSGTRITDQKGISLVECDREDSWFPILTLPRTAPTAHDDQGTPATNPNFDHLLRGTVHDPTTRRMGGVAGHAGVFSTATDTAFFAQALLEKLLANTGPFPLKQSTLRLATSPNQPGDASQNATIFTQSGDTTKGVASRGLGWDLNSPFSRPRGELFPITTRSQPGSFGHTGFTGTSLWIDPTSNTFVILLANSIHPHAGANISPLRGQVSTAVARALGLGQSHPQPQALAPPSFPASTSFALAVGAQTPAPLAVGSQTSAALAVAEKASSCLRARLQPCRNRCVCNAALAAEVRFCTFSAPSSALGLPSPSKEVRLQPLNSPPNPQAPALASRYPEASASGLIPPSKELGLQPLGYALPPKSPKTQTGIDILEQTHFEALLKLATHHQHPLRIGLLSNIASHDSHGLRTIDVLAHAPAGLLLTTLFSPEHGLSSAQDTEHLAAETDPATHLPIIDLYSTPGHHPTPEPFDGKIDVLVIDLQDAGTRFWTYETLLGYLLETLLTGPVDILILDRPNPLGGLAVQGPTSDRTSGDYTNYTPIPLRHGLTFGELARFFYSLNTAFVDGPCRELTIVPMQNWTRSQFFADTALPWIPPSPNLKTLPATLLYPAVGLTEQTNLSVGRGTPTPFENLGAPWLDGPALAAFLTARHIPGVTFSPTTLTISETPEHYPSHGQTIPGIHLTVTDPTTLDSPELGLELLSALQHLYPETFKLQRAAHLLASASTLAALTADTDPRAIAATWTPALAQFRTKTTPYLLYK